MDLDRGKSIPHPNPYVPPHIQKTGTLVILWTRDFRAHSEMVYKSSGFCLMHIKCVCVLCMGSMEGEGGGCGVGCSDFDFFHILRYNHPSLTP